MPKFQINRRTVLKTGLATAATLAMPPILRAADQVKIGFLAPLTGSEAILGIVQLQCYQLAIDHLNAAGGIGDAVASAVAGDGFTVTRLAVREIPRSGTPEELVDHFGISARHIVAAVRK